MRIEKNKNLKELNTFGLDVNALYFAEPQDKEELKQLYSDPSFAMLTKIVTGAGSNILYDGDFQGLLVKPSMYDISIVDRDDDYVYVRAGAGIEWDNFVSYCVDRGWGGVENLSHIPGCVGASPVQNIGAYGCEVSDTVHSVEFMNTDDMQFYRFCNEECRFGYRSSIFKNELSKKAVVTHVTYRLSLRPVYNLSYEGLAGLDKSTISLRDIRKKVIEIRDSKLPDPKVLGNAGSFFKNPVVQSNIALDMASRFPNIRMYPVSEQGTSYKISAAWMIDKCGFKGKREGKAGVHSGHALILVAYEGATGQEVVRLAEKIKRSVKDRFGVDISPEVNIITSS
jgi:UDP-N-acetylmuramate dehydrogenase